MKIGVSLSILAQTGRSDVAVYKDHLELGDLAEPLGFDSIFALEHHFTEIPYWNDFISIAGVTKPIIERGYIAVPEGPGLGFEINEDAIRAHLIPEDQGFFEPTPQWDAVTSHDRLWS